MRALVDKLLCYLLSLAEPELSAADRWGWRSPPCTAGSTARATHGLRRMGRCSCREASACSITPGGVEGRGREVRHGEAMQVLDWLGRRGHRAELAEPGDHEAAIDLLAWDIARGVNVARHAYHAQYISAEEAWTHTRGAARAAQESFPSWEPRERTDNRALVARAERLHEEVLGETRQAIVAFEGVLQNGKLEKIEKQRRKLAEMLDRIDREFRL